MDVADPPREDAIFSSICRHDIYWASSGQSAKSQMAVRLLALGEYDINMRDEMSFLSVTSP
jgi:hypothetical protein